ncbi:MAG TPA: hypothetical protein VF077_13465, partial [Nitrospiraceae bacterium]
IKDLFPNALTIVVPNSGDVIDTGTNQITGAWVGSGGGTTSSTATANPFSGTSGALVRWQTGAVLNGRRVTGRTYLVPLNNLQYANDGSLSGTCVNAIQTAAAALITALAPNLRVYGPPRDADPDVEGDLGKPAIDAATIAAIVPDLAVVMRSRRT